MKIPMDWLTPIQHARLALAAWRIRRNRWLFPLRRDGRDRYDCAHACGAAREAYYKNALKHNAAGRRVLAGKCLRFARELHRYLVAHPIMAEKS